MFKFTAYTCAEVIDPAHPRFGQSGIIGGFERAEDRTITRIQITFAPYGHEGERVWFEPEQLKSLEK